MPEQQQRGAVLVTGATGGIGAATVRTLADRGYTVYAGARSGTDLFGGPARVRSVTVDVTDPAGVAAAAKQIGAEVGGLRAVVNNAGVIVQGPLELVPADELRRQFEVNTLGPATVIREFLPLIRAGGGRIVNVSAPTGQVAMPMLSALSASKAGLDSFSDSLRLELSPWRIPVVTVVPGSTQTAIFTKAGAAEKAAHDQEDRDRVRLYRAHLEAFEKANARLKQGPASKVAETIARAVEARRPRRRYLVGDARSMVVLTSLPRGLRDRLIGAMLGLRGIRVDVAR